MFEFDVDRSTRLQFLRIDNRSVAALREAWPVVRPKLRAILDEFYTHLQGVPALKRLVAGDGVVERLKATQGAHRERLFKGDFDDAFMKGVMAVGHAHARIGLEPRWYIGGYSLVLTRLIAEINQAFKRCAEKRGDLVSAVTKAVFLDMDLSISVYQELVKIQLQEREHKLEEMIVTFDGHVSQPRSVEAARAGEAGKVKNLANQTARATEDISSQIASIYAATEQTGDAIRNIVGTINQPGEDTTAISAAIEEQSATTREIARNVAEAAQGTQEVSSNIVMVSSNADRTGSLSEESRQAVMRLSATARTMQEEIERFLEDVRAA